MAPPQAVTDEGETQGLLPLTNQKQNETVQGNVPSTVSLSALGRTLRPLVLLPGGDAPADVTFCLVLLQNFFDLLVQRAVEARQTLREVLMYR